MPFLTLFTAPKPFTNAHIALIQRNAIHSWLQLGAEVEVLVIGQEEGLAEFAAQAGGIHLPDVARNTQGTPLVSSIFDLARQRSSAPLLAYVNADMLLLPDIIPAAQVASASGRPFLIVGQRWDLDLRTPLEFIPGWQAALAADVRGRGRLHPPGGSDYFIFPCEQFAGMPDFAIGRAGWDNWMIYHARTAGWPVIDATASIMAIHQDHDYSHLPGGQPHYRLPESDENVHLAGGRRTIFTLRDADCILASGRVVRRPFSWASLWRAVEVFPLVSLHSLGLGQLFYAIFHPLRAYRELRRWLRTRTARKAA